MFGLGESCVGKFPFGCSRGRQGLVPRMVVRAWRWHVWQIRTWAKSLLPRWPGLSLKEKEKKKNLDGKKNEITVCQREIDRSGREGGRFLLYFCLLVSKQASAQARESKSEKLSSATSQVTCLLTGRDLHSWLWQFLPSLPGRAAQGSELRSCVKSQSLSHVLRKAISGVMGATGFEMTSSLWRGGSEPSISCWDRIWVAQSRCDPQLPTCRGPPWENIHLRISTNYLHVLHLQMGLIFFWDLRCCHSMGRRGLCWAGMAPLSQQAPAIISVFFIDRPQNTLQKKYHSLPDKEVGAGKVLCLGHQADQ